MGGFQTLHHFTGWDTAYPQCALIQASDGYLYGVTMPGTTNSGTIYRATTSGVVTVLTNLSHLSSSTPIDALVEGADGWLYGVTMNNSALPTVIGGIFKVAADGSLRSLGYFSDPVLHGDGSRPMCGLALGPDGLLYGTIGHSVTSFSNTNNGSVFSMTTNGVRTTILAFGGTNGSNPMTRLTLGSDGALYGITAKGGPLGLGTVFRIMTAGQMTILANSAGPQSTLLYAAPLVQANDGNFYGTAEYTNIKATFAYRLVAPPQLTATASSPILTLTWNSFLNGAYQVYYKNFPTDTTWTALGSPVVATGTSASFTSSVDLSSQRLYQVVLLP